MAGKRVGGLFDNMPVLSWIKLVCIGIGLIFGILYTVPTFLGDPKDWPRYQDGDQAGLPIGWFHRFAEKNLPDSRISLGLDLRGGLHLVLEVDVEKSIRDALERAIGRTKDEANAKNIKITNVSVAEDYGVVFEIERPDDAKQIEALFLAQTYLLIPDEGATKDKLVFFKPDKNKLERYHEEIMDQGITTIRNRIDQFGVSEPNIFKQGDKRVVLQMPGMKEPERAKELIGSTAVLDFRMVLNEAEGEKLFEMINDARTALKIPADDYKPETVRKISQWMRDNKRISTNATLMYERTYKQEGTKTLLADAKPLIVEAHPTLTGELIEDATVTQTMQGVLPETAVSMKFKPQGAKLFGDLTTKAFDAKNVPHQIAIILDENINSAPVVREPILGGNCQITLGRRGGDYDAQVKEAQNLAMVLRAGALPATVRIIEERQVGPSEGEENIRKGLFASFLASGLIILAMFYIYGKSGILANLALVFNAVLILALLAAFGASLTLPGIAGIALTLGMALDGNIIINERVREELRNGQTAKGAFYKSYDASFHTLMDANLCHVVASLIMLYFGNPSTRGFAVTLLIGVVTSMFTSYYVTEVVNHWLVEKFNVKRI